MSAYVIMELAPSGRLFFVAFARIRLPVSLMASVARALARLDGMLLDAPTDAYGTFMLRGYRLFLLYWGVANYTDAAMWARRMAECVSLFMLQSHAVSVSDRAMLQQYKKAIPANVSWSSVYRVVRQRLPHRILEEFGVGMGMTSVWDCISYCQYKGNAAAHFDPTAQDVLPDEKLFVEVIRMTLLFVAYRHGPSFVASDWSEYGRRSRL